MNQNWNSQLSSAGLHYVYIPWLKPSYAEKNAKLLAKPTPEEMQAEQEKFYKKLNTVERIKEQAAKQILPIGRKDSNFLKRLFGIPSEYQIFNDLGYAYLEGQKSVFEALEKVL